MEDDSEPGSTAGDSSGSCGDPSGGGNRCVMGGCSNRNREGFSLYQIPNKPSVANKWKAFISSTRKFKASDYSGKIYICSGHFTREQFDQTEVRMYKQGFRVIPPSLKTNAVPKLKWDQVANPFPPVFFDKPGEADDTSEFDNLMAELAVLKASAAKPKQADEPKTPSTSMPSTSSATPAASSKTSPETLPTIDITDPGESNIDQSSRTHCPTCGHSLDENQLLVTDPIPEPSKLKKTQKRPLTRPPTSSDQDESGSAAKKRRRSDYGGSTYLYHQDLKRILEERERDSNKEEEKEEIDISIMNENDAVCQTVEQMVSSYVQTEGVTKVAKKRTRTVSVMVNRKVGIRDVRRRSKDTQTPHVQPPIPIGRNLVHADTQTQDEIQPDKPEDEVEEELDSSDEDDDDEADPDWDPDNPDEEEPSPSSDESSDESFVSENLLNYDSNPITEPKYVVFESQLVQLFKFCKDRKCQGTCKVKKFRPKYFGSHIKISATCKVCHLEYSWHSQPMIGRLYAGNILLSGSILFAGASPTQVLKVLNHMNLQTISTSAFMDHQRSYLQPSVHNVWQREQLHHLRALRNAGNPITLGGDGRADSPGHCAKFGSYSLMDLESNKIVDVQLVQSTEVTSSNAMELEGLKRAVTKIKTAGVEIKRLVTDRHPSVSKYLRDEHKDIDHRYDVWHIAKGIGKNINALAKQRDCEQAGMWKRSIINHIYWSAASTPDGNPDVIATKYKSIMNHIKDVHTGHGHAEYDMCAHEPVLDPPRVWLKPDTKVYDKLSDIILRTRLVNDIKKMSPLEQTSSLESYHSVLLYFCPKMLAYRYPSMKCRLLISALHWNENGGRAQATKADGTPMFKVSFPKAKAGGYTVTKVLTAPTYGYVTQLMEETARIVRGGDKTLRLQIEELQAPPDLSAEFEHPSKEDAVAKHNEHRRFADPKPDEGET